MPDAILCIQTAYHLAWFFIFSPPAWAGICRTARQGCLIPYSSLSRCNIPRTPLIFFLLLLRFLVLTVQKHCHLLFTDKYLSAKLSPLHLNKYSGCFVSLHTDIPFPANIKNFREHLLSMFTVCLYNYRIYLHGKFSACGYRPAQSYSTIGYNRNIFGQTGNSRFPLLYCFHALCHKFQNLYQKHCLRLCAFQKYFLCPCGAIPLYAPCHIFYDNICFQHCNHSLVCLDSGLPKPGFNLFR